MASELWQRKAGQNPKGGLNAAGARSAGVKTGVKNYSSASDKDKRRWISWARRFAAADNIPPLTKPNGEPTRFALMFTAWGEAVPKTEADVRAVAKKALVRKDALDRKDGRK
jgi:hypothetical protein